MTKVQGVWHEVTDDSVEKCIVYWKYILKTWRGVSFLNLGSGIMRSVFTKTALVAAHRVDWKGETGGYGGTGCREI